MPRALQHLVNLLLMSIRHRPNHVLLIFEVAVDKTDADAGFGADIMHAGLVKSAFGEADHGRVENLGASI